MLLELDVLRDELRKRYSHAEYDLSDLCLLSPGVDRDTIRASERTLGVVLPQSFTSTVMLYDFSRLSLCNLVFDYGPNLEKFVRSNLGVPFAWWGSGARPSHLLLVGTTDGHSLLMSVKSGKVEAIPKSEPSLEKRIIVASDFEILVRTAGSIALGASRKDRMEVARTVSPSPFWQQLADGTA